MIKVFYWNENKLYKAMDLRQAHILYNTSSTMFHQFIRIYNKTEILEQYYDGRVIKL